MTQVGIVWCGRCVGRDGPNFVRFCVGFQTRRSFRRVAVLEVVFLRSADRRRTAVVGIEGVLHVSSWRHVLVLVRKTRW